MRFIMAIGLTVGAIVLAVWPFHHKLKDLPIVRKTHEEMVAEQAAQFCYKEGDWWFFMRDDQDLEIGMSKASCVEAYRNWSTKQTPPVVLGIS
jgi:hypothetical protein